MNEFINKYISIYIYMCTCIYTQVSVGRYIYICMYAYARILRGLRPTDGDREVES